MDGEERCDLLEKISFESPQKIRMVGVLHWPEQGGQEKKGQEEEREEKKEERKRAGVVICHGMLSYKDTPKFLAIAGGLEELGYAVLRFDFVGRGESEGDLLELDFARQEGEALAAIGELRKRGVEHVGLVGSSMGGAVAVMV